MLSPNWKIDLNQETFLRAPSLKIKDAGGYRWVLHFNIWFVPGFYLVLFQLCQRCLPKYNRRCLFRNKPHLVQLGYNQEQLYYLIQLILVRWEVVFFFVFLFFGVFLRVAIALAISRRVLDRFLINCSFATVPTKGKSNLPNLATSLRFIPPRLNTLGLYMQPVSCF